MVLNLSQFNYLLYCRDAPLGRLDKPYRRIPLLERLDKSHPRDPPLDSGILPLPNYRLFQFRPNCSKFGWKGWIKGMAEQVGFI